MNAISMNNLWNYLQGLSLTSKNQRWLAHNLMEAANMADSKKTSKALVFPKVPQNYKPSSDVLNMTCGTFPSDFDVEKEMANMWKEMAK